MSRERPCRLRSKLLHPFAQHVLVDIEVPCRLVSADTAVTNEPNRLDLELSTELPSLHRPPPASRNTQSRCPRNRQQAREVRLMRKDLDAELPAQVRRE